MRALEAEARLHDGGDFLEAAELLVGADKLLELVGVDDDVQHADLRQPELLVLDAARVDDERLLVQLRADGDWRCRTCRSC